MRPSGGLKLVLQAAQRGDRRVRFAAVSITPARGGEEIGLVTDARGRMRYRLPPGNYRLRVGDGVTRQFAVRAAGWTPVRLLLP